MDPKETLLKIYKKSSINNLTSDSKLNGFLKVVGEKIETQTGVYTVLITLAIYKIIHPDQDIRYHQKELKGPGKVSGFSGRSFDTAYITPTLKELKLTSMSESGWLTRSLEQPYPYTENYNGKISNTAVREAFLKIIDYIQNEPKECANIVGFLLREAVKIRESNKIVLSPITDPDKLTINNVIKSLEEFIHHNYESSGGSKIPVLAFYSIYSLLVKELKRYHGCKLNDLGSHTSSDRTAKTSGDIEIYKNEKLLEALEIKLDHEIDSHLVNRAIEKIIKFNPKRYYILSTYGIKNIDQDEVSKKVEALKKDHGCQLIINGLIPSIKYYLRLIENIDDFVNKFSDVVINDKELNNIHKKKWEEIRTKYYL